MNEKEILSAVKTILIEELKYPFHEDEIHTTTKIVWDLGINSIDYVKLIGLLEEKFNIEIDIEDFNIDCTVKELVALLQKYIED